MTAGQYFSGFRHAWHRSRVEGGGKGAKLLEWRIHRWYQKGFLNFLICSSSTLAIWVDFHLIRWIRVGVCTTVASARNHIPIRMTPQVGICVFPVVPKCASMIVRKGAKSDLVFRLAIWYYLCSSVLIPIK